MKYLLKSVLASAVLFASVQAFAQAPKKSPQERAWAETQWMKTNAGLTDEQTQKTFPILFESANQVERLMKSTDGTDKKQAIQDVQATKETKLKAVLSADQYTKLQTHEQEMKAEWMDRKSGN